jgi:hypothetical protein
VRLAAVADPIAAPLTYPGEPPAAAAALMTPSSLLDLTPGPQPPGRWPTAEGGSLDDTLAALGAEPVSHRHPVLAVGSNASTAQLRRKFATMSQVVPITRAAVAGIRVGVSAHVSKPGYVPATPVPGGGGELFVTWLDDAELRAMDATEPNYHRVRLPHSCTVRLAGGAELPGCWIYVSRHGYLVGRDGQPRELLAQEALITSLIAEVPGLAEITGATVPEWLENTRDRDVRERARELLRAAGIVRDLTL